MQKYVLLKLLRETVIQYQLKSGGVVTSTTFVEPVVALENSEKVLAG
jgi:hypothetical protein